MGNKKSRPVTQNECPLSVEVDITGGIEIETSSSYESQDTNVTNSTASTRFSVAREKALQAAAGVKRGVKRGAVVVNAAATGVANQVKKGADAAAVGVIRGAEAANTAVTGAAKAAVTGAGDAVTAVVPQFEPLPLKTFFLLSLFCAIPAAAYCAAFTKMGYGVWVYRYFSTHFEPSALFLGAGLLAFSFLIYLFDCHYWKSYIGILTRRVSYAVLIAGINILVLSISGTHPYGPISVFLVLTTLYLMAIKYFVYKDKTARTYVSWLSGPLFFNSMLIFIGWFIWTFWKDENEWTISTKLIDAKRTGCEPNFDEHEQCRGNTTEVCFQTIGPASVYFPENCEHTCSDVYASCLNTFIIWSGPFLVSAGLLFLSFFTTFVRGTVSAEEEIARFSKVWVFLLFGMWISASLASAGSGLSIALAAITLSAFMASGVFLAFCYSQIEREERIQRIFNNLLDKYKAYLNPMRGVLVITCAPIALFYFAVSGLKQNIRSWKCLSSPSDLPQITASMSMVAEMSWLTVEARRLVQEFLRWDRVAVYTWSIYAGLAFMTLNVASKFTTLFLSWLIDNTRHMELGVVTGIMISVGVIMFLLPPVPGLPIYLTMGVIIIPVGGEKMGITWSIFYAIGVSLLLKLLATFLQQKMIGGLLRNRVGIRQLTQVNSTPIRAMKLLLNEKGLGIAKVSILCGGPDWPTSVLCGIMGLPLIPVLVGTLPVVVLVVPTVLAGSFTYMSSMEDDDGRAQYAWAQVASTLSATAAALVLFGFMLLAAYHIENTLSTRGEEMDAMPLDTEVKVKEDKEENYKKAYGMVTEWNKVPILMKIVVSQAVSCMVVCCYTVQLFQRSCFVPYNLTDTIEVQLKGNWRNLVKDLGWMSLGLFVMSTFLFCWFVFWAKRKATLMCDEAEKKRRRSILSRESNSILSEKEEINHIITFTESEDCLEHGLEVFDRYTTANSIDETKAKIPHKR